MPTSLYGTVKKIGSSQFTFDRIYSSRSVMETQMENDGVYHGRYVLVTYGDKYCTNNISDAEISVTVPIPESDPVEYTTNTSFANINPDWVINYNIDLQQYNNVYDKTVWQKIFDGTTAKYIMVASLNARAPGLTINEDYYSFNLNTDNTSSYTYYTKPEGSNTITIHDGTNAANHGDKLSARYPLPRWHETLSNDLIYHLDMPMPLHIDLAKQPEYFIEGVNNPKVRYEYDSEHKDPNNYIRWEHIIKQNTNNEIIGADFNFNMPALGQAISDAYDALYGIPLDENNEPTTGNRPFVTEAETNGYLNLKEATVNALAQTDYVGLLYILNHIGLKGTQPLLDDQGNPVLDGEGHPVMIEHYYLSSDWDAAPGHFGHIDNKPEIIKDIMVASNGLWTLTVESQS